MRARTNAVQIRLNYSYVLCATESIVCCCLKCGGAGGNIVILHWFRMCL